MEKYNKYKIPFSSKFESMDLICNKKPVGFLIGKNSHDVYIRAP